MSSEKQLLQMKGITKSFPGVRALDNVNLELSKNEILGFVGENGAGKSTLMKVLGGVHQPDKGTIKLNGKKIIIENVRAATDLGISFVHQELNLSDNLTVAANLFLGREFLKQGPLGLIDKEKMHNEAKKHLDYINVDCDPQTLVKDLTIGTQQMIEIAKALSMNAKILIMDEPTSSLAQKESDKLFEVIKELKATGVSVIYISHRMGEVKDLADRVIVLRDGKNSGFLEEDEINKDSMIKLMVGRDIDSFYHVNCNVTKEKIFEVKDYIVPEHPNKKVSFHINKGEIVTLAGLVGAGRTELLHSLFGITDYIGGKIILENKEIKVENPRDAIDQNLALVPEDRKQHGLILEMNIEENITLSKLNRLQKKKLIQFNECADLAKGMSKKLNVKMTNISQSADTLSGGNQQKLVLGKWLALGPKVLFLDEPTRGIDVIAKEEIYRLMETLAEEGMGLLVASSEMQEVLGISDRVIVLHEGEISGELTRDEFSEEAVVHLATGGNK
jgi:ribose transport system ATP-binding protein